MAHAQRKRAGERKVLDYYDVLLREQDVALLEGPHWLNDQVVAFFFEYLGREGLLQECGSSHQSKEHVEFREDISDIASGILLVPPATSFLLMHSPPELATEVLQPLQPHRRSLVLFPVNDNPHVDEAEGGSHWTLLVYHRPSNTLRHYDSSPASSPPAAASPTGPGGGRRPSSRSSWAARKLAEAVGPALVGGGDDNAAGNAGGAGNARRGGESSGSGGSGDGGDIGRGGSSVARPKLVEVSYMPSQTNWYDCGVYVLAVARATTYTLEFLCFGKYGMIDLPTVYMRLWEEGTGTGISTDWHKGTEFMAYIPYPTCYGDFEDLFCRQELFTSTRVCGDGKVSKHN
ncbi:hypothetical protein VOLCADRAFT_116848 [Volvox carteri f. nagariensis]|uniref:Ubiquitin-like protease family profile domain-containing protein n=1 Tax=Volvox carteri f. nagariensis TaxID=3068 RepID=D8TQ22_VOLCA|nr:uncharacterized protein VOLCADRAFT_116848 [Volvox carteri f. nagariensis]EFJ50327.1 hypothetical protein VOLCADRAFT_116848 [Volvox carteri f. nagariensis]|eukprot:XP_002948452.1 hypothetical protein VOLCADRAFT_116848 [Volvox carteri f. nagariensis]